MAMGGSAVRIKEGREIGCAGYNKEDGQVGSQWEGSIWVNTWRAWGREPGRWYKKTVGKWNSAKATK